MLPPPNASPFAVSNRRGCDAGYRRWLGSSPCRTRQASAPVSTKILIFWISPFMRMAFVRKSSWVSWENRLEPWWGYEWRNIRAFNVTVLGALTGVVPAPPVDPPPSTKSAQTPHLVGPIGFPSAWKRRVPGGKNILLVAFRTNYLIQPLSQAGRMQMALLLEFFHFSATFFHRLQGGFNQMVSPLFQSFCRASSFCVQNAVQREFWADAKQSRSVRHPNFCYIFLDNFISDCVILSFESEFFLLMIQN